MKDNALIAITFIIVMGCLTLGVIAAQDEEAPMPTEQEQIDAMIKGFNEGTLDPEVHQRVGQMMCEDMGPLSFNGENVCFPNMGYCPACLYPHSALLKGSGRATLCVCENCKNVHQNCIVRGSLLEPSGE